MGILLSPVSEMISDIPNSWEYSDWRKRILTLSHPPHMILKFTHETPVGSPACSSAIHTGGEHWNQNRNYYYYYYYISRGKWTFNTYISQSVKKRGKRSAKTYILPHAFLPADTPSRALCTLGIAVRHLQNSCRSTPECSQNPHRCEKRMIRTTIEGP